MSKIKFVKIRDVKSPERANNTDSWIDFFIPKDLKRSEIKMTPTMYDKDTLFFEKSIEIPRWFWVLIPSWIKCIIEPWYDLVFENKSWISTKFWLMIWAKVVDSSYRWEVHLHLINTSNKILYIDLWAKIAQWILRKVELDKPLEITYEEFNQQIDTDRWENWFGSTWI